jgi:PKD repeat protein
MLGIRWGAALVAVAMLASALPLAPAATPGAVGLGVTVDGAAAVKAVGGSGTYASFWAGAWMATSGWGGLDGAIASARAAGATPLVYWYYWGDSISPACVESGCSGKSRAQWDAMTTTLVGHLQGDLAGAPAVVVLENEFNKNGVDAASYAPTFDAYLAAKAVALHQVPNATVVLGFGGWGEGSWGLFPKAIAASDLVGFQTMRASTRDTVASYTGAPDRIAQLVAAASGVGARGSFLYDLALSSYPDATWEGYQNQTLAAILAKAPALAQQGLAGIVYREVNDNPGMSPANYYGYAEQHWGLRDSGGTPKAAWGTWTGGAAPAPAPAPPAVPGSFEGESMRATTGGRVADASASGGAVWNLWSNGAVSQVMSATAGAYQILVTARGSPASGAWPTMEVRLNGALLGTANVASSALTSYRFPASFPDGASTLSLSFTNDLMTSTEDRNLYVDVARIAANRAPVASFATSGANLSVVVDGSASSDPDGDALSYAWDFGDGATATGASVTHAYATGGAYQIALTVSDGHATARATANVTAVPPNRAPTAAFQVAGANLTWAFDATGSRDADGDALTYLWSFGDGASATGPTTSHTYAAPGSYAARVVVSDGRANASATAQVTASYPPPRAAFNVTGGGATFSFDASASEGAAPLSYRWDFGDGSTATGATTTHAYATGGARAVTLSVSDGYATATAQRVVNATVQPFAATFSTNGGNAWWLATRVSANEPIAGVCASINGGACQPLTLQSWGEWAASYSAPNGSRVTFTATSTLGHNATSPGYFWTSGVPWGNATFSGVSGNNWWVQASVGSNLPVAGVCASVNGGTCQALALQSWGGWAASIHAADNANVAFRATLSTGQVVASAAYTWSSKV